MEISVLAAKSRSGPLWLAIVLLAVAWVPTGVAGADPIGSCTPSRGVIVAVDFSHWSGDVQRGCDASPTTGFDALHAAGFSTTGTFRDGPAFICRIDGYPTKAQDACNFTPPTSASWSYWHANAGQNSWSYSSQGAASYHPTPGSVDAWEFGAGNSPSFSPAQVRVTQPPASPTPPRTTSAGGGSTPSASRPATGGGGGGGGAPTASRAGGSTSAGRPATRSSSAAGKASSGPTNSASPSATGATATPSDSGPRIVDAVPVAERRTTSSPLWPVLLTVAAVVLLTGGAGWTSWQRRRRG